MYFFLELNNLCYQKFPDNLGKQGLWLATKPKIINPAAAEFIFLFVRKLPKTSETNLNGLAAHLKNAYFLKNR